MFVERRIPVKIRFKWIACVPTLCPSVYPAIQSIHPFKHSSNGYYIVSFLTARKTEFKEYVPSVFVVSRETDLCGRGPGPHGAVFIPDHNFTKIYLEICG